MRRSITAATFTEQTGLVSTWLKQQPVGSRKLSPKLHLVQESGLETACGHYNLGDSLAETLPMPPVTENQICGVCVNYWRARDSDLTTEKLANFANYALGHHPNEEETP